MKKVQIPKTDLNVSQICLGTMTFGTPVGEAEAVKLIHYAYDKGINFIDTANMYEGYARSAGSAGGVAEEIVGKALAGRRDDFVVATKVGMKVGDAPEDEFTSPAAIRKHLDKSLARLATDCVDIYYLHRPDPVTPMVEVLGALNEAIGSGKIRYYGVSNYSAEQLADLLRIADANKLPRPVIVQPFYSLIARDPEQDLLPLCEAEQIAVVPYRILASGLLTGKYHRGQEAPAGTRMSEKPEWFGDLTEEVFDKVEQVEAEAKSKGRTLIQHAVLAVLEQPSVVSVILGVKRLEQLQVPIDIVEG